MTADQDRTKIITAAARRRRGRSIAAAVGAVSTMAGLVLLPASAASATTSPGQSTRVMPPSNAAANPFDGLLGVSCTGPGSCAAVGGYDDSSEFGQAMVAVESHGGWARAQEIRLPSGAAANPNAAVNSIACAGSGSGSCVGVGGYSPLHGVEQGLIVTESRHRWGRAAQPRLPLNSLNVPDAALLGVSCSAAGHCAAVGFYADNAGRFLSLAVTESGGRWRRATAVASPPNAAADPNAEFLSVACTGTGSCEAVGLYTDASGQLEPMAAAETAGRWRTATETGLPGNAAADPHAQLTSIACRATGSCTAVGSYRTVAGSSQGMTVTESRGHWGPAAEISPPADAAADPNVQLTSVACTAAGSCLAVGGYFSATAGRPALSIAETRGHWAQAREVQPPPDAATGTSAFSLLISVSCRSGRACTAVGRYADTSASLQAMAVTKP